MDLLMTSALRFQNLINYEYRFTLGRKGKLTNITLGFSETDFHHLAGLHKLKDIHIARANRNMVFRQILDGHITFQTLSKSQFLPQIKSRLDLLPKLELLLDTDQLIFRYHKSNYPYSTIEGEYLLRMGDGTVLDIAFLFLDRSEHGPYFCRSFFPLEKTDYSKGQMQYTLLKKEKYHLKTGQTWIPFDRLSHKQ